MDLGIAGRRALVCASSRGLGRGCATALAREGAIIFINGTTEETLQATAAAIRAETGAEVTAVRADVATPEGRETLLAACPDPTSSSTTPAARRPATSASGRARTGSRRSMPT